MRVLNMFATPLLTEAEKGGTQRQKIGEEGGFGVKKVEAPPSRNFIWIAILISCPP